MDRSCIRRCPSPSNLITTIDLITCIDCSKIFKNKGALHLHRVKSHGQVSTSSDNRLLRGRNGSLKAKKEETWYFCPVDTCKYNGGQSINWFGTLANLKQHYGKVHGEKRFVCSKCHQATFSLEKALRYHEKRCPVVGKEDGLIKDGSIIGEQTSIDGEISNQKKIDQSVDEPKTDRSTDGNQSVNGKNDDQRSDQSADKKETADQPISGQEMPIDNRSVDQPIDSQKGDSSIQAVNSQKSEDRIKSAQRGPILVILRPAIILKPPPPKINRKKVGPPRILPKPITKWTVATQTEELEKPSISTSVQCDQTEVAPSWPIISHDQLYATPTPDLDQLATAAYVTSRYSAYESAYQNVANGNSAAVQSESVAYNDFFCQTYMVPHMADAAVSADFRVSTTTSGQQCQLFEPGSSDLLTPPPPFDDQRAEDSNLAWTNNETQTDIAMMEFDDLFSYVGGWQDMETQT